jgi:hypothetical protein
VIGGAQEDLEGGPGARADDEVVEADACRRDRAKDDGGSGFSTTHGLAPSSRIREVNPRALARATKEVVSAP